MAAITAAADDRLLRRTGGTLNFGQLTAGMVPNETLTAAMMTNRSRRVWIPATALSHP
jgi:hypothetical protein